MALAFLDADGSQLQRWTVIVALFAYIFCNADVRGPFLAGGLLSVAACAVLLGGRLLRQRPRSDKSTPQWGGWDRP